MIQQEATEDLQRQAAVGPIDGTYLEAGFGRVWYNRVKWLAVLFFAQMFTINVMATYEDDLKAVAALAAFVPLCLSVGGNTGSQAATLVIRALAPRRNRPVGLVPNLPPEAAHRRGPRPAWASWRSAGRGS